MTPSWFDLEFTSPIAPGAKPEGVGLDEHCAEFIRGAQETLDFAIYDFDLQNVADALVEIKSRGVRVRGVFDNSQLAPGTGLRQIQTKTLLRAGIPIVSDDRAAIMHNKFFVRDNKAVWTGSWNPCYGDTWHMNNLAAAFYLPQMAEDYTCEFEKMFVEHHFGANKKSPVPFGSITLPTGGSLETYFSPQDNGEGWVVSQIESARTSVHFLAFSFTSHPIGQAMIQQAKRGVKIRGVVETTGALTKDSQYLALTNDLSYKTALGTTDRDVDVRMDGNPYPMHHKFIVIDEKTVLMGSFNFSTNANAHNDENLNIIHDPTMARLFMEEFSRVANKAKGNTILTMELRP